ncbi:MAG: hypothetical protein U0169_19965 [Polyangiaceae bacterium]
MGRRTNRKRAYTVSAISAIAIAAATMAACTSEATAIRYTPSSLVTLAGEADVVLRVFEATGTLAFCQVYRVDESRTPGETMALMDHVSSIVLSPRERTTSTVRIVAELHPRAAAADCDRTTGSPIARHVAIVGYAAGKTLELRSTFDVACVGVLGCDPVSETCSRGACVDARATTTSGSVGDGCFDIRACPTLARVSSAGSPCRFTTGEDPDRGYVAVAFTFPGATSGDPPIRGAAVAEPGDVARVDGRTVELGGRLCELVKDGSVTDVYFGFACEAPTKGTALCPVTTGRAEESPLVRIVTTGDTSRPGTPDGGADARTDGPPVDATVLDATTGDAATGDAATRDATLGDGSTRDGGSTDSGATDARTDGSRDSAASMGDDGGSDASTGFDGGDDFGRIHCADGMYCDRTGPSNLCCVGANSPTPVCGPDSLCPLARYACDDAEDCGPGFECCESTVSTPSGPGKRATCTPSGQCDVANVRLCSSDFRGCRAGEICGAGIPGGPSRNHCMTPPQATVACGAENCPVPTESCCVSAAPTCTVGSCATPIFCDDLSDCGPGTVCCLRVSGPPASTCKASCEGTEIPLCGDLNETCPLGTVCGPPVNTRSYARRECR